MADVDWDKVNELLEPWQQVWAGDKAKFTDEHPQWMIDAGAELFAHDLCDAWAWNDYVQAATVIISRHYAKEQARVEALERALDRGMELLEAFANTDTVTLETLQESQSWLEAARKVLESEQTERKG